jgi:hypothetical protein
VLNLSTGAVIDDAGHVASADPLAMQRGIEPDAGEIRTQTGNRQGIRDFSFHSAMDSFATSRNPIRIAPRWSPSACRP